MFRKFLIPSILLVSTNVSFSQVLYNNATMKGLAGEGLRTRDRAAGGSYSEVQVGNSVTGFRGSVEPGANDRLADDFDVTGTWKVTGASFFMYETDVWTNTITSGLFEIHEKTNGTVGAKVATGSFAKSTFTDIYRVYNGQNADNRRIQKIDVNFMNVLGPGSYYMVWATAGIPYKTGPWNPYLVRAGSQTVGGANALYSLNGGQSYSNIQDGLLNQDFPFMIYGSGGADWGNGYLTPEPSGLLIFLCATVAYKCKKMRKS